MSSREPITADEAFEGLPSEIRKAIEASGWQEKIRRIAGAHKLRVDQGSALEDESLRFMAGLQSVEEYAVHLAQELALPDDEFRSFIAELEKEIFMPIQADIRAALQPTPGHLAVSSSVGEGEEDDLEALLNEGEDAIAKVAATAPVKQEPAKVLPATPAVAPAPVAAATVTPALAAAAQKLALPVSKPAEMIAANLQKPVAAPAAPIAPAIPKSDPYRESF
jgi:hypothetical protein